MTNENDIFSSEAMHQLKEVVSMIAPFGTTGQAFYSAEILETAQKFIDTVGKFTPAPQASQPVRSIPVGTPIWSKYDAVGFIENGFTGLCFVNGQIPIEDEPATAQPVTASMEALLDKWNDDWNKQAEVNDRYSPAIQATYSQCMKELRAALQATPAATALEALLERAARFGADRASDSSSWWGGGGQQEFERELKRFIPEWITTLQATSEQGSE
jgi:hypothetical protein